MGSLSSAKTLGGIGAILMIVGVFIPLVGVAVSIAGIVMVYLGVKNISEAVNDIKIKSDFVLFIITAIIALIIIFLMPFVAFGTMGAGVTSFATTGDPFAEIGAALAICAVMMIIAFVFYIFSAIYLKRSFEQIAAKTKVSLFKTTGLIYLIGAILTIIGIGIIIMWIAYILMIVAFFSLPDTVPTGGASPGQSGRNCPGCGRPIPMDSQVCPYCGKDFRPK